ncbi:MAG: hypothetical protein ABIS50_15100 [Luteolibacter sp.]|uniref:hypothetical protein n=1 Tax=Luteolibacter sp. TaxID=1962973 RepID=UPI0032636195
MAVNHKSVKGTGLCKLRSSITSNDGTTLTEVETWNGPYSELKTKQLSVVLGVKGTNLVPTEADHGILTITREVDLSTTGDSTVPNQEIIEVLWPELRKAVETNLFFKDLTDAQIQSVKKSVAAGEAYSPEDDPVAAKLWSKLARGNTEWSTGVPVVRRTTTKRTGKETKGKAWYRDTPPVDVEGDWEFLKTVNETRRDGKSYTQTEEWTGAEKWDEDLYPVAGGGDP